MATHNGVELILRINCHKFADNIKTKISYIMKKIIFILAIAMLVAFTACQKEEVVVEAPGEIPGMGNAVGELQVQEPFNLPDGIELVGSVGGLEPGTTGNIAAEGGLKSTETWRCYGSGGRWVKLAVTLKNTSNKYRTVFFPRGLLFKVNKEGYQHAMTLQWTWVCIQPNAERSFALNTYCINKGKHGSDPQANFSILGITNSETMWRLLRMIGWRKINLEHYQQIGTTTALKADELTYDEIQENLQDAVWSMTNGAGLIEEQIQFIESIPMLEDGSYPEGLDDTTVEAPYYFDEYTPVQ